MNDDQKVWLLYQILAGTLAIIFASTVGGTRWAAVVVVVWIFALARPWQKP